MKEICKTCEHWDERYEKCENPQQYACDADDYMAPPEHHCELWERNTN